MTHQAIEVAIGHCSGSWLATTLVIAISNYKIQKLIGALKTILGVKEVYGVDTNNAANSIFLEAIAYLKVSFPLLCRKSQVYPRQISDISLAYHRQI